jgi:nucleosome binding factor SPN SPT16 subunit
MKFDPDQLEWAYTPIIQSGGNYDLRPSALSNEKNLEGGCVLCSIGVRYKSYCSNVGRTYLFDPNFEQEKYYNFLVSLQKKIFEMIKDGAVIKDIYNNAVGQVRAKFPEIEKNFVKNLGSGIGIEFRDSTTLINGKNTRTLKAGMTLNVSVGFQNIPNPNGKNSKEMEYSLLLVDTVIVTNDAPIILTDSPKDTKHISFFIKDEVSEEEKKPAKKDKRGEAKSTSIIRDRTRGQGKEVDETDELRRREHQKELHVQKQQEGLARFKDGEGGANGVNGPQVKKFESYKRPSQLPSKVDELRIVVDTRNQSIIVPVYGIPVPFHISTLRNASKNDEGDFVYLRLNFLTPGQGIGKQDALPFDDPSANFVRSLTFRSADAGHMSEIFRQVQELKKNAVKREAEKKEMEDVVDQDNLREIRNRRPQRLMDVYARPNTDNKRLPGELEIHENGLRYQTPVRNDSRIDLLFNNIRHVFFQPNDHELVTIIHVHLRNPIMVGKRKTKDVQFYREVTDAQVDETGNRKRKYRYGDDDEHEQEAEERRRRAAMNKEFKEFAQKIADAVCLIEFRLMTEQW